MQLGTLVAANKSSGMCTEVRGGRPRLAKGLGAARVTSSLCCTLMRRARAYGGAWRLAGFCRGCVRHGSHQAIKPAEVCGCLRSLLERQPEWAAGPRRPMEVHGRPRSSGEVRASTVLQVDGGCDRPQEAAGTCTVALPCTNAPLMVSRSRARSVSNRFD